MVVTPAYIDSYRSFLAGNSPNVDAVCYRAMLYSAMIIFTTLHAQDFADVEGDAKKGRETFPIRYPQASRVVVSVATPAWSLFLSQAWVLGPICSRAFVMIGCWIALRFWRWRSVESDRRSYVYYNVS
jgi:4-hydroxybenzoate polyprenyltransferase